MSSAGLEPGEDAHTTFTASSIRPSFGLYEMQPHSSIIHFAHQLEHHESFENFDLKTASSKPIETKPAASAPATTATTTITATPSSPPSPEDTFNNNNTTTLPAPVTTAAAGHVRNYQVFPGRNRFFCGGRLMTSREYWAFAITFILLVAPCVLFGIFTCPFLWYNIHPAVPIIFAYMFCLAFASMIKTSWTDPGIIPRGLDDENDEDQAYLKEIQIRDRKWTLKYCETCRIYRPPRASHCRQCDNCVENEDHHCIWLNNCIGRRNYRSFFVCIATSTLLCIYVIAFSVTHVVLSSEDGTLSFGTAFDRAPVSFCLAIVCFVLLIMVGGLTTYHCSLIIRGVSTHEQLRAHIMRARDYPTNPYMSKNPFVNILHILCRPQPKSYLRRRKWADE